MQSPTPPTKPTPPTPPSMKTSATASSTDLYSPVTTTPQSINPSKAVSTSKEQPASIPDSVHQPNNTLPPQASITPSTTTTSKETTSETAIPSTTQLSKKVPSSSGFSAFFVLIFIIGIALVAVHWWKNYKPKQGSTVDYSTESSDEIVNLIFSENILESAGQALPKRITKKVPQQTEPASKTKGNFEVRV